MFVWETLLRRFQRYEFKLTETAKLINSLLYSPYSNIFEMKAGRELMGAFTLTCLFVFKSINSYFSQQHITFWCK